MPNVSAELVYEIMKQLQDRMARLESRMDEVKAGLRGLHSHAMVIQQDTSYIDAMLGRHENGLIASNVAWRSEVT